MSFEKCRFMRCLACLSLGLSSFFLLVIFPALIPADCRANEIASISSGDFHNLLLRQDGSLWAWGANYNSQLGDGSTTARFSPVRVGSDTTWAVIDAGGDHNLAIKADGSLWAWGFNQYGQVGDGTVLRAALPFPIDPGPWSAISAGDIHSLGIRNGALFGWGNNWQGQIGTPPASPQVYPAQIGSAIDWVGVSAGVYHSVALQSNGAVYTWGSNSYGQLGDPGIAVKSTTPREIPLSATSTAVKVVAGQWHTMALLEDGSIWVWGDNRFGQIGIPGATGLVPKKLNTDTDWIDIAAGATHSMALKANGTLWAWGDNQEGQYGDGTKTRSNIPVQIGAETDWLAIAGGERHTFAVKANNLYHWTWGDNLLGQLGDNTWAEELLEAEDTDSDGIPDNQDPCINALPIRNYATSTEYYTTLANALNDNQLADGQEVLLQQCGYYENIVLDKDVAITISGGHDCGYFPMAGLSSAIRGSMTVSNGTLVIENIVLE